MEASHRAWKSTPGRRPISHPLRRREPAAIGGDGQRHDGEREFVEGLNRLSGGDVPDSNGSIRTRGEQPVAVGTEDDGVDVVRMTAQGPGHEVGGCVPDPDRAIAAGRGEPAAVGAECDRPDGIDLLMIVEGHPPSIAGGIPESNGPVLAARSQLPAIRAERDARYFVPMSAQDQVFLPRGEVPDAHRTILIARGQSLIIGAEDDGVHGTRMQEREEWVLRRRAGSSPRRRIPNMDAPIDAGRREAVAVGAERQARDLGQVGLGGRDRFQIGGAPDPDDPGEVGGGKVPAIRAPRDGLDDGLMTRQLHGMCWPRYVPDQHLAAQGDTSRVVSTTGSGDVPAVRAEGNGPDGVGVPLELAAFLACRRVPDDEVARPIGQGRPR